MDDVPRPGRRTEFLRSPHHTVMALATAGLGLLAAFATGHALPLLVGAGLYALGWIYLPDLPFFRRWLDRRYEAGDLARAEAELRAFQERRTRIIEGLGTRNRARYAEMISVCQDIERANRDAAAPASAGGGGSDPGTDPRLRKLDELAWTYLRLLAFQQALEEFLETERREDLPAALKEAESETSSLQEDIDRLRARKEPVPDSTVRLHESARDRAEVLLKRIRRVDQAKENLKLSASEQERLVQQVKLVRADAVAGRNARNFSARIDATVEHLDETNRWLTEIEDFKDLVGDMPRTDSRIGLGDPAAVSVAESVARFDRRRKEQGEGN